MPWPVGPAHDELHWEQPLIHNYFWNWDSGLCRWESSSCMLTHSRSTMRRWRCFESSEALVTSSQTAEHRVTNTKRSRTSSYWNFEMMAFKTGRYGWIIQISAFEDTLLSSVSTNIRTLSTQNKSNRSTLSLVGLSPRYRPFQFSVMSFWLLLILFINILEFPIIVGLDDTKVILKWFWYNFFI